MVMDGRTPTRQLPRTRLRRLRHATCSQAGPPYCEPLKQLRSMARLAVQSHLYMSHAVCPHLLSWQLDFGVDAEAVSSVWRIQVCYNSDIRPVSTSCSLRWILQPIDYYHSVASMSLGSNMQTPCPARRLTMLSQHRTTKSVNPHSKMPQ